MRNKSDSIAFFENFMLRLNNPNEEFEIKDNDIVVDIGAHIGYFTIYAAKRAIKGKIYAIEPFRDSFDILEKNVVLNNFSNVKTINTAISKINGKIELYINRDSEISNSIIKTSSSTETQEIISLTLEEIMKQNDIKKIDFLKLDCEGAEFEILLNLNESILKKIHRISAEIHSNFNGYDIEHIISFLKKNNFVVNSILIKDEPAMTLSMIYAINESFSELD